MVMLFIIHCELPRCYSIGGFLAWFSYKEKGSGLLPFSTVVGELLFSEQISLKQQLPNRYDLDQEVFR